MQCRKKELIKLPKTKRDSKETEGLCQCHPVCKSRRREWHGMTLNPSAELLLERKPLAECFRRFPTKVYPNSPCPLLGRTRRMVVKERDTFDESDIVRICTAPIDDEANTPYLAYAEIAKKLGAWNAVAGSCGFCPCGVCPCSKQGYRPRDADRELSRRIDMREFDLRVKTECVDMKIMYD